MKHPSGSSSAVRRSVAMVSLLILSVVAGPLPAAHAAVSVERASLRSGTLAVEGRGARASATMTASSPESTATGRADRDGRYKISSSNFRSSTCKATISDGSTSAVATLSGCTPTTTPPATPSPQLTPDVAALGPGFVGSDFTTFSATTTTITFGPDTLGPVRFEITAGQLPAGLSLVDPNAGFTPAKSIHASIAGTPTTVQSSTFTIKATDANGLQASRTYTININPPRTLEITPQPWAPLAVGTFSNLWIDGSGGTRPYRWARTAGEFPPGMSLIQDNPDGPVVRISGTPTTPGTFTFTLQLTDASGVTVSRSFSLTVPEPAPATAGPEAPTPLSPDAGATVTQPFTISWSQEIDPASTNGGYNWQVSTSSSFSAVVLRDSTRMDVTQATISGLADGSYYWRVQAVDNELRSSAFSLPRSFTVPAQTTVSAVSLSPTSVTSGGTSTATVALSGAAPAGGVAVALSSSNGAVATVPGAVTVAAGATSATFTVTAQTVTAASSAAITAAYGGASRAETLTVSPVTTQPADTVAVQRAAYDSDKRLLQVEATSTSSTATLRVYVSASGAFVGTMSNDGGGRYRAQLSSTTNPQNITVRSSLGGSATRAVVLS